MVKCDKSEDTSQEENYLNAISHEILKVIMEDKKLVKNKMLHFCNQTKPTLGFNMEKWPDGKTAFNLWELGGTVIYGVNE